MSVMFTGVKASLLKSKPDEKKHKWVSEKLVTAATYATMTTVTKVATFASV